MTEPRSGSRLSRREFIGGLGASVLAGACARQPYRSADFRRAEVSRVGLFPAASYATDLSDVIYRGLRELSVDVRRRRVFLKPNLVEYEHDAPINTHPLVVMGAAVALARAGAASVVVGEGPGHRRDIEYLLGGSGLFDHLREHRLPFVDLNHDDVRMTALGSHFTGLDRIALPASLLDSDFIVTIPKLKTHHWAGMTAGMKNLFGTVPGAVYGWPKNFLHIHGIDQSIVDLGATIRPHLSIVDAVIAMEGDGPIGGQARPHGFVAMGTDVVAVDAVCARSMGLDPARLPYLQTAGRFLGHISTDRIRHVGEAPGRFAARFAVVPAFEQMRLAAE